MLYHISTIFKVSVEPLNKINEIVSTSVINSSLWNQLEQRAERSQRAEEMNLADELNQM